MTQGIIMAVAGPAKRISGSPNKASSAAMVRSQSMVMTQPSPRACPCTEAMMGVCSSQMAVASLSPRLSRWCVWMAWWRSFSRSGSLRSTSWPAQKLLPSPRRTMTVTPRSWSAVSRASSSARDNARLRALRFSGRFSEMTVMSPSFR